MLTAKDKRTVEGIRLSYAAKTYLSLPQAVSDIRDLLNLVDKLQQDAIEYEKSLDDYLNDCDSI